MKKRVIGWRALLAVLAFAVVSGGLGIAPARAAEGSVDAFAVSVDAPVAYLSGYGMDNVFDNYHFTFTPATALSAGDTIRIEVPGGFGHKNHFMMWSAGSISLDLFTLRVDGTEQPVIGSASTELVTEPWTQFVAITLSGDIGAGSSIDIHLRDFIRSPERLYTKPGPKTFRLSTSKDPVPRSAQHNLYSRWVTDYYPDAGSYTVSEPTDYQFKFTVNQPLDPSSTITVGFPEGMAIPEEIDLDSVKINGVAASSVLTEGNAIRIRPSESLDSFSTAVIRIDGSAGISNPSGAGYYDFTLGTSNEPLPKAKKIGFVPASGSSLNGNAGRIDVGDGMLRFFFPSHTILKGGDTITVKGPNEANLSGIDASEIIFRSLILEGGNGTIDAAAAAVTAVSQNEIAITVPDAYYLEPDYYLEFSMPDGISSGYGEYPVELSTSRGTLPVRTGFAIRPATVQNFSVTPSRYVSGAVNVDYTFRFEPNYNLRADFGQYFKLRFPDGIPLPAGDIEAGELRVTVNGQELPKADIGYSSWTPRDLTLYVPDSLGTLEMLKPVTAVVYGLRGALAPGNYTFSVLPDGDTNSKADGSVTFYAMDSVSISGDNAIAIRKSGSRTVEYSASVKDPGGTEIPGEKVIWSLAEDVAGVSVNAETGALTVQDSAAEGTVKLVATSVSDPVFKAEKEITLAKPTWVSFDFANDGALSLNIGETNELVLQAKDSNGEFWTVTADVYTIGNADDIVHLSDAGVITGIAEGSGTIGAEFEGFTATLEVTVSGSLHEPIREAIDRSRDGIRIDEVLKFIRAGDGADLNGDGTVDGNDLAILLRAIAPVYTD